MAETVGLVQRLSVFSAGFGCFWIGPLPTSTEVLIIQRKDGDAPHTGAFKNTMIEALTSAHMDRLEVKVNHPEDSSIITSVSLEPS